MKALKRVLCALSALALVGLAVSCKNSDDDDGGVTIGAVTFSPASGTVSQGTPVSFSSTTANVDFYYSTEQALTSENYLTAGKLADSVEVTENCTIYAIAVDANGNCSSGSSAQYQVTGPKAPTFTLTNGDPDVENGFYTGYTTLALASATEGATVYYSTTRFDAADYANQTTYADAITLTGALNEEVTYYAVAVNSDGPSMVTSETFTSTVRYLPLTDDANYEIDGNIDDVIAAIGDSSSAVTFSEAITVSGYVTMTNGKTTSGNVYIQDKNASIIIFNYNLDATAYTPGEYVTVTATKGQLYYGNPEISAYNSIEKTAANDTTTLYYKNLTGKTDFSGLETLDLCGINADKADYTSDEAVISSSETGSLSHFGYVSFYESSNQVKFISLYTKDASVIGDATSTLTNTVNQVVISATSISSDDEVTLATVTPNATIYYSLTTELTADNYSTAGTAYSSALSSFAAGKTTIYVYAVKTDYTAWSGSFTVTCLGANDELIEFADYADSIETSNSTGVDSTITGTNVTIKLSKGSGSNNPIYNSSESGIRVYQNNTIDFTSTKSITAILFNWTTAPGDTFAATTGSYDSTTKTWTGFASSVSFGTTSGSAYKLSSVIITYSDLTMYDDDVEFSVGDGYLVDAGTSVTLSVPTSASGASIYYSTETALDYSNYTEGTPYTTALTINETTTVYAVLVSSDAKTFSSGTSATYTVDTTSTFLDRVTSLSNGDVVYFYNAAGKTAMSSTTSNKGFTGASVSVYNDGAKMKAADDLLALKAVVSDSGVQFTNDGKYLTTTGNNNLTLADATSDNAVFTVTATADGATTFYISGTSAQLEYYNSNWTTYGTSKTGTAYEITLYK